METEKIVLWLLGVLLLLAKGGVGLLWWRMNENRKDDKTARQAIWDHINGLRDRVAEITPCERENCRVMLMVEGNKELATAQIKMVSRGISELKALLVDSQKAQSSLTKTISSLCTRVDSMKDDLRDHKAARGKDLP